MLKIHNLVKRSRAIEAQPLGKMMKCVICQHGETKPNFSEGDKRPIKFAA
ncbi:MAG: hypothetical protein V7K69_19655 [Nostoc sp.]